MTGMINTRLRDLWGWLAIAFLLLLTPPVPVQQAVAQQAVAQQPPTLNPSSGDRLVASVTPENPFVGQQVVYSVRFYAQRMPADYQYIAPDFAGLWRGEQIITEGAEVLDGVSYTVRTYETLVYPLQPGPLTIAPARLVVSETVFSDRVALESNTVTVNVQPLPQGAPAAFTGGVGRFQVEAEAAASTITLGQPLTLRWTVTGAGNLAQIAQPDLMLPEVWRVYSDPTTTISTTRGAGERIFEWRLIAEQVGTQTIPAQTFAYFEPEAAQYVTMDVPELVIDVLPDAAGRRELPEARRSGNQPAALPLKTLSSASDSAFAVPSLPLWAWVIPPLAVLMTLGGQVVVQERRDRDQMRRQNRALSYAKAGLQAALRNSGSAVFSKVRMAVVQYAADLSNREVQGTVYAEIDEILSRRGIPPELRQALALCWLEAEEGLYAPADSVDADRLIRRTAAVLTAIDAQWKPPPDDTASEYES